MSQQVIYKITNLINGKFYVGSTNNQKVRFREHRKQLRGNRHHCKHLQAAWNKYGETAFTFNVIQIVPAEESLEAAEDKWLNEHVGKKYCYNSGMRSKAPWRGIPKEQHPSFGRPKTEEQRQAISQSLKEFYAKDITNHPRYGKTHSDETKNKISTAKRANPVAPWIGTERSEETRKKIGDAQRGKSKAKGRVVSAEGKAEILAAAKAGHYSHWKGRKHTEEAKVKMSKTVFAMPDGILFISLTQTLQFYGLKMPTLRRALNSGTPIKKGPFKGYSFTYGGVGTTQTLTDKQVIESKLKNKTNLVDQPNS